MICMMHINNLFVVKFVSKKKNVCVFKNLCLIFNNKVLMEKAQMVKYSTMCEL